MANRYQVAKLDGRRRLRLAKKLEALYSVNEPLKRVFTEVVAAHYDPDASDLLADIARGGKKLAKLVKPIQPAAQNSDRARHARLRLAGEQPVLDWLAQAGPTAAIVKTKSEVSGSPRSSGRDLLTSDILFGDVVPKLLQTFWPSLPLAKVIHQMRDESGPFFVSCSLFASKLGVAPPENAELLHDIHRRVQADLKQQKQRPPKSRKTEPLQRSEEEEAERRRREVTRERWKKAIREKWKKRQARLAEMDRQEAQRIEAMLGGETIMSRLEKYLRNEEHPQGSPKQRTIK